MRNDVTPYDTKNINRNASVLLWPVDATFQQIINDAATPLVDLSPFVSSVSQTDSEATIRLSGTLPFTCSTQPKPGQIVSIEDNGRRLMNAAIDNINDVREERGTRQLTLTLRSRDSFGLWRENHFVTQVYSSGTEFSAIAKDIAQAMGLARVEYQLPATGFVTPHTNSQMSDLTPWDMLNILYLAAGRSPFFDVRGRLKLFRRDIGRDPDLVLGLDRVLAITGSKASAPITNVKVKWLDRHLSKALQQDQVIKSDTVTAGFFQLEQRREQWFSEDRTQRAENTYLRIIQSVNGLIPFATEEYTQISTRHGELVITLSVIVPSVLAASILGLIVGAGTPDGVSGLSTVPIGRLIHASAEIAILLIMISVGTGSYEIWGQPFDYVHAINTSIAFNKHALKHSEIDKEISNDFIFSETHGRDVAVRELLYENASAMSWGANIVDDPRIEVGDIIELPDASRLFITGYQRSLSRGEPAVLSLSGFRC